jgi:hypothetical protein
MYPKLFIQNGFTDVCMMETVNLLELVWHLEKTILLMAEVLQHVVE